MYLLNWFPGHGQGEGDLQDGQIRADSGDEVAVGAVAVVEEEGVVAKQDEVLGHMHRLNQSRHQWTHPENDVHECRLSDPLHLVGALE